VLSPAEDSEGDTERMRDIGVELVRDRASDVVRLDDRIELAGVALGTLSGGHDE
jgi:hypothetical protein